MLERVRRIYVDNKWRAFDFVFAFFADITVVVVAVAAAHLLFVLQSEWRWNSIQAANTTKKRTIYSIFTQLKSSCDQLLSVVDRKHTLLAFIPFCVISFFLLKWYFIVSQIYFLSVGCLYIFIVVRCLQCVFLRSANKWMKEREKFKFNRHFFLFSHWLCVRIVR